MSINRMEGKPLTEAQIKISNLLERGFSVSDCASELGLHENSVRAQIKRIKNKENKSLLNYMENKSTLAEKVINAKKEEIIANCRVETSENPGTVRL